MLWSNTRYLAWPICKFLKSVWLVGSEDFFITLVLAFNAHGLGNGHSFSRITRRSHKGRNRITGQKDLKRSFFPSYHSLLRTSQSGHAILPINLPSSVFGRSGFSPSLFHLTIQFFLVLKTFLFPVLNLFLTRFNLVPILFCSQKLSSAWSGLSCSGRPLRTSTCHGYGIKKHGRKTWRTQDYRKKLFSSISLADG